MIGNKSNTNNGKIVVWGFTMYQVPCYVGALQAQGLI